MRDKCLKRGLEDYLRFVILFGFSTLMLKLCLSGEITYYVNPKLEPLVLVSAVLLALIAIVLLTKSQKYSTSKNKFSYLLLIIPLCMGFFVSPKIVAKAELQLTYEQSQKVSTSSKIEKGVKRSIGKEKNPNELEGSSKKLVLNDRNFVAILDGIYTKMNYYTGYDIEITGKVFKDSSLKEDEFVIVRPMMTCCSADTSLVGLLCNNKTGCTANKDQWVKLEGRIKIIERVNQKTPIIDINSITYVDKPDIEFVYPN